MRVRPWSAALIMGAMTIGLKALVEFQHDGISSTLTYPFLLKLTGGAAALLLVCEFIPLTRKWFDVLSDNPGA